MRTHRTQTVAAAIASILATAAYGQEADKSAEEALSEIIVTGTRTTGRTRLDSVAPVDVLSAETLGQQGTTELAEAMSTLAPSLDFPRPAVTDGTDHVRPATLRGLAPDQTLVLVNSKRRHPSALVNINSSVGRGSAAVDLNAIPMAAVERIEVLRDGASAQYGSDAIAGVINIQLRQAREGGAVSLTYGKYDTSVQSTLAGYDKSDGRTFTGSGWLGFGLGADGFLTVSAEYRDRNPTSRGDLDPRLIVPAVDSRYGDPETRDVTVYLNAGAPLGGTWSAYGWAGYQNRDGAAAATPRVGNNATSPNVNNDPRLYPNGFLPVITTNVDDIALAFGARGSIAGWDSDVSLVYGRNAIDYGVEKTLNGALVNLASPTPTQTTFDAGGLEYDQITFNFGMVRGFDVGLSSPLNVALGLEARRESFEISAGEPNSYGPVPPATPVRPGTTPGAQGFPGFQPSDAAETNGAHRRALGAYVDVETQFTDKFRGSAAVRAEDYDDFGSNVSGKIAGRFDFTPQFALRGAVSNGFRAPGVQQQYFSSTATNFIGATSVQTRTLPVASKDPNTVALLAALGAKQLDPEKSRNYSLGAVIRTGGFEATIDAYRIDIDDRIVLTENITLGGGNAARFFTNGVDTETKGIDAVLRYTQQLKSAGTLGLTLSGNHNNTDVKRRPTTAPNGQLLFNNANLIILQGATPDNKISFITDWSHPAPFGRIGASVKATRYGDITDPGTQANGALQYEVAGRTLVDLEARGTFGFGINLALGVDNVFDQYPNPTPTSGVQNNNGLLGFSRFSPYGFNGRFVYARFGLSF